MEKQVVEKYVKKINAVAEKALAQGNIDKTCTALSISAGLQYEWNQDYTDDACEDLISNMVEGFQSQLTLYEAAENTVLFYDSFGLDTRGLALIYLKALCDLGYRVIYIVPNNAMHRQPEIKKQTDSKDITFHYLENGTGKEKIKELISVFARFKTHYGFFYTTPNDIEACVAFGCLENRAVRYQINLTDHAFWLGRNAFDYCLEFREYGACISCEYRKIPAEKLRLLPYYPYVDETLPFAGFPFDRKGRKVIFSGGGLYKTIDEQGTYYDMVAKILAKHTDTVFMYAGSGDKSHMLALQGKFPGRVFLIEERKDLYALLQNCNVYLNTYPLIGGLMTQYAAAAGRMPLTLVNYADSSLDGLLLNHQDLGAEFSTSNDLLAEMDRLLDDDEYRHKAEEKIASSVMTEVKFKEELQLMMETGKTSFNFTLHHQNTEEFRSHYVDRFTVDKLANCLINKRTLDIWYMFPGMLLRRVVNKILSK